MRAGQQVQAGESPEVVIGSLGSSRGRIYGRLACYRAGGVQASKSRKLTGRPEKLTGKHIKWVYDTVTLKNPLQYQFGYALWTREMIRTWIYREFSSPTQYLVGGPAVGAVGIELSAPASRAGLRPDGVRERQPGRHPRIPANSELLSDCTAPKGDVSYQQTLSYQKLIIRAYMAMRSPFHL